MKFCSKCGYTISNNAKFCSNCGSPISQIESIATLQLKCSSCNATLSINEDTPVLNCPFCGSAELIKENDVVTIERIKAKTRKDIEFSRQELQKKRMENELHILEQVKEEERINHFKNGTFGRVLISFAIISAITGFFLLFIVQSFIVAGIIAIVQSLLYLIAWLMGTNIMQEKKKNLHIILAIIAFALIMPFFVFFFNVNNSNDLSDKPLEKIVWSDLELGGILPVPDSLYGEVGSDLANVLSITLYDYSESQYESYLNSCVDKGFIIDSENSGSSYNAYNQEGYQLRLVFMQYNQQMNIFLDAPINMSEFEWSKQGPARLLPVPQSTYGKVTWDNSETYIVYVGKTPVQEYEKYVNSCIEKGFTIDHSKTDKYYSAKNWRGYELTIRYLGFDTMEVSILAPEKWFS